MNKEFVERLKKHFPDKKLVFGDGEKSTKILLIGEAPGEQEAKQGKPFVGKAGKNLDEFISILKLQRKDLYITNVVKFRPTKLSVKTGKPINRPPKKDEISSFKPYLIEEIETIKPKVIVTLGNTPLKALLGDKVNIGQCHGEIQTLDLNGIEFDLMPLYHPAAIIYNQSLKEIYANDLERLRTFLEENLI
ncbi:MAG: uracil-DNA glycosylase [Tissierellales bacterium]|nr:uracil-DNA glycosylase [Tissierellales bacterium]